MRHGAAPSAKEAGVDKDFDRPLSDLGRKNARKAASYIAKNGGAPAKILVSPLIRAQQTAAEVATVLNGDPENFEPLANQVDGMTLIRRLTEDYSYVTEVLLIGHQPQIGEAANYLTGLYFELRPAGVIGLERDDRGKTAVLWAANPDEYA